MAIANGSIEFEGTIKTIVNQSFPFAKPAENVLAIAQIADFQNGIAEITTIVPGTNSERFVWGVSRIGSSSLVG
jgi:hypothetical protein